MNFSQISNITISLCLLILLYFLTRRVFSNSLSLSKGLTAPRYLPSDDCSDGTGNLYVVIKFVYDYASVDE